MLESVDSDVYLAVLRRIQSGEMAMDDRIVDSQLAVEFSLSRMPVRQALLRLVHEGYLVGTTRGFVLPRLSPQDIEEIFEVRLLIEPRAAASACQVLVENDITALRTAFSDAQQAVLSKNADAMMGANERFRQVWLQAVPNRRLAASIRRHVDHVQIVRRATVVDGPTQQLILTLLAALLIGFEKRDALQVFDATVQFVARARECFFAAPAVLERGQDAA
ncbi:GntR family transcriptional regulator [Novosphingobium barchaimii LL02]|uniref:GntR family transcriptional regulator n=1 Tax=Novosphingobium barchaimii LL02 TaxID=1114963 RepID=A0A0J7XPM1_9SPHN|nr:GntR family transcriptional regulator [Novosphingobium barchaimii LL02]